MGDKDKVYTLVIKVDLSCCRCHVVIQEYLCKIQCKENIVAIVYDVKNNVIRVSGPFDAAQLQRHLLCKFPKIIKGIDIIKPSPPKPPDPPKPEPPKPPPPPKDECKEKCMKWCEEKCEKICKCIEECKKGCEEKCKEEFEEKCKCKSKCKCKPKCCKEKPPSEEVKPPIRPPQPPIVCPQPPIWPPPPNPIWPPAPQPPSLCQWPQQVICCVNPCPCFVAWSNNWKCCNCGVVCWPVGPSWGSGQGSWGRPQGGCGQGRNVVIESAPPCTIM